MAGYEIGLSGMHAAQKALDIIGNNIANAATDGYHLQEVARWWARGWSMPACADLSMKCWKGKCCGMNRHCQSWKENWTR
ncbi:MAG: flagellar basal body protein [Planctomycetota bacterium]